MNAGASLMHKLIGQAPNRTLVVQWKNYRLYGIGYPNTTAINFQIRMNESDNSIEIKYGNMAFTNYNWFDEVKIGLWGFNAADVSNRILNVSNDMNNTSPGPQFNDIIPLSTTVIPPVSGLTMKWTVPVLFPPTEIVQSKIKTTRLGFRWMVPPDILNGNYEYAITTNQNFPATGTITDSLFCDLYNLNPGQYYYFHIRSRLNNMVHSAWNTIKVKQHVSFIPSIS
ncbi:MAG: hypothetical protein IPO92_18025 [Saprospiraceae bacterium]|nr:hypothetical protein [Saprospiraceae bacterium]